MDNFSVKWKHNCYLCTRPLDIYINTPNADIFMLEISIYIELNPFDFNKNKSEWKFFGVKARKVCHHCRINSKKVSVKMIFDQQMFGKKPRILMDNTTYTHDDMYAWFKQMSDFFKRDDWLACVPEHHSKRILNLGKGLHNNIKWFLKKAIFFDK